MRKMDHATRSGLVSIFTPVYNDHKGRIYRAFYSLKEQDWRNWEWVSYDDSDEKDKGNTWETLKKLRDLDRRIKIIKGEKHSGHIGYTKHQTAMACRGYILVELDYDDELTPSCLSMVKEAFDAFPDSHFAFTDFAEKYAGEDNRYHHYTDNWGRHLGGTYYQRYNDHWATIEAAPVPNSYTFSSIVGVPNHVRAWRRDFYKEIGGHDETIFVGDDYELLVRTVLKTKMIKIPALGYIQYRNENRDNTFTARNKEITRTWRAVYKEKKEQLENHFKDGPIAQPNWRDSFIVPSHCEVYQPNQDLVSIIMPTYNRAELLRKAIDSVKAQTIDNWELIIVGDKCPTLVKTMLEETDRRIKWWNLSKNNGPGGTVPRNYALKTLATGHWIAYLDDDNQWRKDHLESLILAVGEYGADYGISSFTMNDIPIYCKEPMRYRVDTSSVLHKASLLKKYGYWKTREEVGYAHDWELVSRWKDHSWAATNLPTLLYHNVFGAGYLSQIYNAYSDQPQPFSYYQ